MGKKKYLQILVDKGDIEIYDMKVGDLIKKLEQFDPNDEIINNSYYNLDLQIKGYRQETDEEYKARMEKRKKERQKAKEKREKIRLQLLKECKKYGLKVEINNDI